MSTIRGETGDLPKVSAKVGTKKAVGANIGKEIINIGKDGTTFIPNISEAGWLSWTNTGGLPNPKPVNLKGGQGDKGEKGDKGDPYTLTAADKAEMVSAVISALPKYNGEVMIE